MRQRPACATIWGSTLFRAGDHLAETPHDPNVAPTHLDVHDRFQAWQVAVCVALGGTAIVAGIVLGLILQNN